MASPRKSAQLIAAREKARPKAADFTARNEEPIELAAGFIEFDEAAQDMEAAAQEKFESRSSLLRAKLIQFRYGINRTTL